MGLPKDHENDAKKVFYKTSGHYLKSSLDSKTLAHLRSPLGNNNSVKMAL